MLGDWFSARICGDGLDVLRGFYVSEDVEVEEGSGDGETGRRWGAVQDRMGWRQQNAFRDSDKNTAGS